MYFDLNRFKAVNDQWGQDIGDQLLKYVASRVNSRLRSSDIFVRLGGDEFTVLLQEIDRPIVQQAAERIVASVLRPYRVNGISIDIGISVGIALFPEHGNDLKDLLQKADAAMYTAKINGGGIDFHEPEGG